MCRDNMDTTSKLVKTDYLRQAIKVDSTPKWKLFFVSPKEDEALKNCLNRATRANRKSLQRGRRRSQLTKLAQLSVNTTGNKKRQSAFKENELRLPAGAKAPENTTQYLMSTVYEDMVTDMIQSVSRETPARAHCEPVSPSSEFAELDCDYDGCLAFQQRDFEETFGHIWKPE